MANRNHADSNEFPEPLSDLFWDYDVAELDWRGDRDFIVRRVLSEGTWRQIRWVRDAVGDSELRRIIVDSAGRNLTPRQLRFWQLILDLPDADVDRWLSDRSREIWDRRVR